MLPCLIKSIKRAYSSGFKQLRRVEIDELSLQVREYEHIGTGAQFYHLEHGTSADAFSIAFRTLPENSTGLPHILEHTTLCGSQAFPVRDPFFKMLNRSLAVYMNAWTGSDFTQYPFVTENPGDYANLRRVYLDAVFRPLLKREDFLQEGWRFYLEEGSKEIKLGGIVYNEMKGALSDPDSYFLTRFQQARFGSDSIYSVVSGGDPREIPLLKHEDLVAFHRNFYHPSNSVTVSTGKQSVEENMAALEEYFSMFSRKNTDSLDRLKQGRNTRAPFPSRIEITGPVDPLSSPGQQIRLLVSFLANDLAADPQETFNLKIMSELLFEGPATPFYQALIDSGLGSEYAPGTGYDTSTAEATLSVGLQGLSEDKIPLVEEAIDETFKKVRQNVRQVFSPDRVETVLHQIELGLRHTSASHFGLNLAASVTQAWIHGGDPISALSVKSKVEAFKKVYASGGLFEGLLDRYVFGGGPSRLSFIMRPDPNHAARLEEGEVQFIKSRVKDDKMIEEIKDQNFKLSQSQNSADESSKWLPCLKIDQVSEAIRDKSILPDPQNIYESICKDSNDLCYFKSIIKIDSEALNNRQVLLLPLLMQCLSELGGSKRSSAADFDSEIKRYTGGLNFSINQSSAEEPLSLLISSFAFEENVPKMLELLRESLAECNFFDDLDRIKTFISASATALASSIAASGNRFAALKAGSAFDFERVRIAELLNGISQARFLNDLQAEPVDKIAQELFELRNLILSQISEYPPKTAIVHSNSRNSSSTLKNHLIPSFYESLKSSEFKDSFSVDSSGPSKVSSYFSDRFAFIPGPFSSNYSALVLKLREPGDFVGPEESALLNLTAKLLRSKYLHREIREKGGAYGSAATFSPLSGLFTFSSYRDPTPTQSLRVFERAPQALLQSPDAPDEQDLLGAKLSVFSDLDAPVNVSSRALNLFLHGELVGADERRQRFRNALRSASLKDVKETIEGLLLPVAKDDQKMRTCVIGEEAKTVEFQNNEHQKWSILK